MHLHRAVTAIQRAQRVGQIKHLVDGACVSGFSFFACSSLRIETEVLCSSCSPSPSLNAARHAATSLTETSTVFACTLGFLPVPPLAVRIGAGATARLVRCHVRGGVRVDARRERVLGDRAQRLGEDLAVVAVVGVGPLAVIDAQPVRRLRRVDA